jgi:hypothetical protein
VNMLEEHDFVVPDDTRAEIFMLMMVLYARRDRNFVNGRLARNMFGEIQEQMAQRLSETAMTHEDLTMVLPEDVPDGAKKIPHAEPSQDIEIERVPKKQRKKRAGKDATGQIARPGRPREPVMDAADQRRRLNANRPGSGLNLSYEKGLHLQADSPAAISRLRGSRARPAARKASVVSQFEFLQAVTHELSTASGRGRIAPWRTWQAV